MKYFIARPIEGISLNGNEYLLDNKTNKPIEFKSREGCLAYIKEYVDKKDPEDYIWEQEEGVDDE